MNSTIIRKHNERVKEEDKVYFLGDFGFYASRNKALRGEGEPIKALDSLKQLNGHFTMIKGNHDKNANKLNIKLTEAVLEMGGLKIQLLHNPKNANIKYDLILAGHVHNKWTVKEIYNDNKKALIINVGVDVWNFFPISWDEIQGLYLKWHNNKDIFYLNKRNLNEQSN